jgi:hypothetical protein
MNSQQEVAMMEHAADLQWFDVLVLELPATKDESITRCYTTAMNPPPPPPLTPPVIPSPLTAAISLHQLH